jgi:thymidylate synthase (FAD)
VTAFDPKAHQFRTIPVLDFGYCRLIDWMGRETEIEPDVLPVNGARTSLMKETDHMRPQDARLLDFLAARRETSPYRHGFVSYEVMATIDVARQWFKYSIGSQHTPDTAELIGYALPEPMFWRGQGDDGGDGHRDTMQGRNESSRRYVTLPPVFHVPEPRDWRAVTTDGRKQGSDSPGTYKHGRKATEDMRAIIYQAMTFYEWHIENGMAPEMARRFLPAYALYTCWRWSCSIESVTHFLTQRLGKDAQHEIHSYAVAVRDLTLPIFPASLKRFAPQAQS